MSENNSPSPRPSKGTPAPGKAGRLARSRAGTPTVADPRAERRAYSLPSTACLACHAVKQRCDGPSVCPCHRCTTFGIECVFPSSAGAAASRSTLARSSPTASVSLIFADVDLNTEASARQHHLRVRRFHERQGQSGASAANARQRKRNKQCCPEFRFGRTVCILL